MKKLTFPKIIVKLIIIISITIVTIFGLVYYNHFLRSVEPIPDSSITSPNEAHPSQNSNYLNTNSQVDADNIATNFNTNKARPDEKIPDKVRLKVPFTSQAPLLIWDAIHEDACEEASLIMVKHFLNDTVFNSKEETDSEINSIISYEQQNGYDPSITLSRLNRLTADLLDLKTGQVKTASTVNDIKKELADGHPVIVGAAGKILFNPNFKNGGPNYHMIVITGYDETGFVTNDPGTRLGENYQYDYGILFNAIHDYDSENILNGGKKYLVF